LLDVAELDQRLDEGARDFGVLALLTLEARVHLRRAATQPVELVLQLVRSIGELAIEGIEEQLFTPHLLVLEASAVAPLDEGHLPARMRLRLAPREEVL